MNENIEKYSQYAPDTSILMHNTECVDYQFCYTHRGELNLRHGEAVYHDMAGALEESRRSIKSRAIRHHKTLILYGLGLGYDYLALNDWLNKDPKHMLLILEDDIMVMKKFMETEVAEKMLSDPQVIIHYVEPGVLADESTGFSDSFKNLLKGTIHGEALMIASPFYTRTKHAACESLRNRIYNFSMEVVRQLRHLASDEIRIFINFYSNILRLPGVIQGLGMKDTFKNIPAFICGAGPSITQELESLRSLDSQGLIIGSGTGMNVLNNHNVFAHLGIGLDPTNSQGTRIRTNRAYECPYAYQMAFHTESFDLLHGPKILFHGLTDYRIREWFFEKLGIEAFEDLDEGVSSTNLAMGVARFLGCNPIFLLGCDLAYRKDARYPQGVHAHASDPALQREKIESKSEAMCMGKDSEGDPLITKAEWVVEGEIISKFCKRNPDTEVINCTEGGLDIEGVETLSFEKVLVEKLHGSYDIQNRLHTAMNGLDVCVTQKACLEALYTWQSSLKRCEKLYDKLLDELKLVRKSVKQGKDLPSKPYSPAMEELEVELQNEEAYRYLLTDYIDLFEAIAWKEKVFLRCHSENPEKKQLEIDLNSLVFFRKQVQRHLFLIDRVLNLYHNRNKENFASKPHIPEIPRNLLESETQEVEYRTDGTVFCKWSSLEGALHGPFKYFGKDGKLCALSVYNLGKKDGRSWTFYENGEIQSNGHYEKGKLHGEQFTYYREGYCKSIIPYLEGKLHGEVRLFYENGSTKRIVQFEKGKLHGVEKYWGPNGLLIWECEYHSGEPCGIARSWHLNGIQATECVYDQVDGTYHLKEWNEKGHLVYEEKKSREALEHQGVKLNEAIDAFEKEMHVLEATKGFYQNKLRF